MRLTNENVERIVKEATTRLEVRDTECPGLSLRLAGNGKWGTWNWRFGHGGRRVPLGRWPGISLKSARDLSAIQRVKVVQGVDPIILRREAKAAPTITQMVVRFKADHLTTLGARTSKEYERILDRFVVPKLGPNKARELDRPAVIRWHQSMRSTPRQANHALSVLSKMMSMVEMWGERSLGTNPCRGVPRFDENERQTYLKPDDLARVAVALGDSIEHEAIRVLIFTGMRVGEVLALTVEMLSMEAQIPHLTLPAKHHKTGKKGGDKTIPLSAPAMEVLRRVLAKLPRGIRGNIFPLTINQMEHAWQAVRVAAKIENVRIHDLRHTFGSWGAAANFATRTIGALVGHRTAASTNRYTHLDLSPLALASEHIGAALSEAMKKAPEGA